MASKSQAGYGSRLQNSKDLIVFVKSLTKYAPIIDDIKLLNYEPYVTLVSDSMSPYNGAHKDLKDAQNAAESIQNDVIDRVRKIRNVLLEIYGKSEEYDDYNEIIDVITGDNVRKNSYKRKKPETPSTNDNSGTTGTAGASGTTGTTQPDDDFQSVSQQDRGSILAKYIALIDALTVDTKYAPTEPELMLPGLNTLADKFADVLKTLATKMAEYEVQRSKVLPMFDGPGSLHERAERAKFHVKRQYGPNSIEFKTLTGKEY